MSVSNANLEEREEWERKVNSDIALLSGDLDTNKFGSGDVNEAFIIKV